MGTYYDIKGELEEARSVLDNFINNPDNIEHIEEAACLMSDCIKNGGVIYSAGNGGSHCDAMHFAEELTGRYRKNRCPYGAIAIDNPGHLTCVGNDYGFEDVFSRFIEGVGRKGDVFLGISTSGNSENILRALRIAKNKGMKTVALTGKDGGKAAALADVEIRVPHKGYADRIQEVHIKIIHILINVIEAKLGTASD